MKRFSFFLTLILLFMAMGSFTMAQGNHEEITLKDIYKKGKFHQKSVHGLRSMDDGIHYTVLEEGSKIIQYSYKTGKSVQILFDASGHPEISSFRQYEFSRNENKILVATDVHPIYRRSFTARYYVYDRDDETLQPLSEQGAQRLATFSPDGSKVGFVRENDL